MSYTSLLIDTCTIQRSTDGAQDGYGQPAQTWTDWATAQACRLMATQAREITLGAEVVIADYKLFLEDLAITEQDRVIIGGITYEVLQVATRQDGDADHHVEAYMRTVR